MVVGEACSGSSTILRRLLFDGIFDFTKELMTEHVTLSM